jgi:hypothetical protein
VSSLTWAGAPLAALANVAQKRARTDGAGDRQRPLPGRIRSRNAANDARAMAALLEAGRLRCRPEPERNPEQMTGRHRCAGVRRLRAATVGPPCCSTTRATAAQLDWRNYLLPVDGDVESASDIRSQCVDLGLVLKRLGKARARLR